MVWHWTCEWKAGDTSLLSGEWLIRCVGRHRGIDSNHFQYTCAVAVPRCFYFVFFLRLWNFGPFGRLERRIADLIYCDYCAAVRTGKEVSSKAVLPFSHAHAAVCGFRFAVCGLQFAVCEACGLRLVMAFLRKAKGHQVYTILTTLHYTILSTNKSWRVATTEGDGESKSSL